MTVRPDEVASIIKQEIEKTMLDAFCWVPIKILKKVIP